MSGIPSFSSYISTVCPIRLNKLKVRQFVNLFTDDTKISKPIFNIQDYHQLRQDITDVVTWTEESLLKLHPDKYKYIRISQKNSQFMDFTYNLFATAW